MDPFESRDKIPRTPPGQSFVNKSLVTDTEAGLNCSTYESGSRRSFADRTPEKHTLALRNSGTAWERYQNMSLPIIGNSTDDVKSPRRTPPPTVIRRDRSCKRPHWREEYSSFISLERNMVSTPISVGDDSAGRQRLTGETDLWSMDPFESRDKIPRTPPGQSFVNKSLVTDTEAGLNCSTYESGSRRSFADRTPEKHTLALRNSGTAWERYQNMSLPIIGNSTDDVKSPRRTPPPTVIRRDRSCKRPHWREEYSSFISLERNMVSTPISVGDDSAGRQRLTGETDLWSMDPFESRDKIPRTPPGQSFVNKSLVTDTEAGLNCSTYESGSRRSFADRTPEKHTLALRNSGTAWERYQNMSLPIIGNSTDDVKSPRRTPPPTVIRRDRSCKRPHWREEYSSFISLERNMVSTPISVGDDSAGRQRLTGETDLWSMDPFESRDKIPRTPPGQSFVNKSLVTDTEAGLNCSTYESGSRRSFADRTPEKHTLALRNSGTAWERYQNMSLPIIGNSTDDVKSPRRTPPPTVIRRDRSCKRPHWREEYSSFISLERNMVSTPISVGDDSAGRQRLTGETDLWSMDPFESRDKIPRTPPGQSFVNKSLVTDTEAGLNCSTYESGSRRSFADRTPEKHTLALRNSGTAWERYQNMSLPIIGNSTDDVKSPRRTPPPTVIRRDRSCKRPHWREEYSSFISLERNMVSTPISVGDDSAGRQRLTGEKGFVSNT
nr:unnamed protein product [Trichobilharzia regenti]